jgi:hypothetical protein
MGIEGMNAETISASMGAASAMLIQSRLVISASSGFACSAVTSRGSSAMPQIGHEPGPSRTICGCIGHVYPPCCADFACVGDGGAFELFCVYFSGEVPNFAAQPWLQK